MVKVIQFLLDEEGIPWVLYDDGEVWTKPWNKEEKKHEWARLYLPRDGESAVDSNADLAS